MGSTPVQHSVLIVSQIKCESGSSRFQPGEGPSRGLLRDYEPSDAVRMELFEALMETETSQQRHPQASTSLWSLITWLADKSGH